MGYSAKLGIYSGRSIEESKSVLVLILKKICSDGGIKLWHEQHIQIIYQVNLYQFLPKFPYKQMLQFLLLIVFLLHK